MARLPDGSIIPSHLQIKTMEGTRINTFFNNYSLRIGAVTVAYSPTDQNNVSKKAWEYDVVCFQSDGLDAPTMMTYRRCIVSNMFGASSDYLNYTLRASPLDSNGRSDGAAVLLLCLGGDQGRAYIVGAATNANRPADNTDDGHHLDIEFNGVHTNIDKDGQLKVTQKGPTDIKGTPDTSSVGSNSTSLLLDKNGSFNLSVDTQSFIIDKSKKQTILNTDTELDINCNGNIKMQTTGVLVNTATDAWVMGTTYRNSQRAMHLEIEGYLAGILSAAATASAALASAGGFHTIPVAGPIIGAPFIITASVALGTISGLVGALQTAITTFEAGDPIYLSKKHFVGD